MKTLVTAKTIRDFANEKGRVFVYGKDTLITPSAKDVANQMGVTLKYDEDRSGVDLSSCKTENKCETIWQKKTSDCKEDQIDLIVEAVIKALLEKGIVID